MERNNKLEKSPEKPLWKKVSTGTVVIRTPRYLRIKHNQLIQATKKELGNQISNFELVKDGTGVHKVKKEKSKSKGKKGTGKKVEEPENNKVETFDIVEDADGAFDVVSSTGKVMNAEKLQKSEAKELKKQLEVLDE